MMSFFSRKLIEEFLTKLDDELKLAAKIHIIGGAAATIAYESKDGTKDIDTWRMEESLRLAIEEVQKKYKHLNLPVTDVTVQVPSEAMRNRFVKFNELSLDKLIVYVPDPEDLFLLKAQRADEKDIEDLKSLNKNQKLNQELILTRFKEDLLPLCPGNLDLFVSNYLFAISQVFSSDMAELHQESIS